MSREPIFTSRDLQHIHEAAHPGNDVVHHDFADWILRVTRDRSDIRIPAGTLVVARKSSTVPDGAVAVAVVDGEFVLRRAPVTDGQVVGVVLGELLVAGAVDG